MINQKLEEYNLNCNICKSGENASEIIDLSPSLKNAKKEFDNYITKEQNAKVDLDKSITSIINKRNTKCETLDIEDIPQDIKDKEFNEVFKEPPITFRNGDVYKGSWNPSRKREGYGVSISKDNLISKGIWKDDKLDEYGQLIDMFGNNFSGQISNGQANGEGNLEILKKIKYKGNFVNNLPYGQGRLENLEEKYVYEGEILEGKKNGKGKIEFTDTKIVYEGDFVNDCYEGQGKLICPGEFEYEGGFKNNVFEGEGEIKYEDGRSYTGSFKNGLKNGSGKFIWDNDNYYVGDWINDMQHGKGVFVMDGKPFNGIFKFGKIIMADM